MVNFIFYPTPSPFEIQNFSQGGHGSEATFPESNLEGAPLRFCEALQLRSSTLVQGSLVCLARTPSLELAVNTDTLFGFAAASIGNNNSHF